MTSSCFAGIGIAGGLTVLWIAATGSSSDLHGFVEGRVTDTAAVGARLEPPILGAIDGLERCPRAGTEDFNGSASQLGAATGACRHARSFVRVASKLQRSAGKNERMNRDLLDE
jgi:hypothetical protein